MVTTAEYSLDWDWGWTKAVCAVPMFIATTVYRVVRPTIFAVSMLTKNNPHIVPQTNTSNDALFNFEILLVTIFFKRARLPTITSSSFSFQDLICTDVIGTAVSSSFVVNNLSPSSSTAIDFHPDYEIWMLAPFGWNASLSNMASEDDTNMMSHFQNAFKAKKAKAVLTIFRNPNRFHFVTLC